MKNEHKIISEILKLIDDSKAMQVKKQCVELLPQLIQYLPEFQNNETLFKKTIMSIFNFMGKKEKASKDGGDSFKGVGFISLGKISLLVSRQQLEPYLNIIFDLVDAEIKRPSAAHINKDWY